MRRLALAVGLLAVVVAGITAWSPWEARPSDAAAPAFRPDVATPTSESSLLAVEQPFAVLAAEPTQDDARASISIAPEGSTEGTLIVLARSQDTLEPLPDVRVWIWPDPHESGFGIDESSSHRATFGTSPITDAEGRAEVSVPPARKLRVEAQRHRDLSSRAKQPLDPFVPGERREIELLLATSADLPFHGCAIADESGAPLADAWVTT